MKKLCVGFAAVYISVVSASFALGQTQQTVLCQLNGTVHDLVGSDGDQSFSPSSGYVSDPSLISAEEEESAFEGGSSAAGAASATAGDEFVHVSAGAFVVAGPPNFTGSDSHTSSGVTASATAIYSELLTFHDSTPGTPIHVVWHWNVDGSTTSSAGGGGETYVSQVSGNGNATLTVSGTGLSPNGTSTQISLDSSGFFDTTSPPSGPYYEHQDTASAIDIDTNGIAGIPIPMTFRVDAVAYATAYSGDWVNAFSAYAQSSADFGHTISWGGIDSVTDADGNPIDDWTVTSASGLDYTYAVPEPATFVLLAIALPGLLLASRCCRRS